jgi:hypothetical protein
VSRGLSITLIVFGVAEHFFFRITNIPHLAIIIGVLAVVLAGIGLYGMLGGQKS